MTTTFNTLDLIFFAFTAIFVITATFRGFVKEVFSLLNWIFSLVVSYLLTPYVTEFLSKHFDNKMVIDLFTRSALFAIIFIAVAMLTSEFRDSLRDRLPKAFDRSLGLLFGFVKTLLVFGAIYSIYLNAYELVMKKGKAKEPKWFEQAKSRSLIKVSADIVDPAVRKLFDSIGQNFEKILPKSEELLNEKIDEIIKEKAGGKIEGDSINSGESDESLDTGYSKKNIEKLNQLVDVINK